MADDNGLQPYHVPQHSRRHRLRIHNHLSAPLLPLYDSSDFNSGTEGGMNLVQGFNSTHMHVDRQLPQNINPSSINDINDGAGACVYSVQPCGGVINTAATGQSLCLSLSSHQNNLPLELNLQQRYDVVGLNDGGSASIELSKSTVPLGPFTGYASVLKSSRFLKPAQQLLEEICDVGRGFYSDKIGPDSSLLDPPPSLESLGENGKKSKLLSMLDEVYKRYKQYYQQMQVAVAAFESIAGLSSAPPFANLAVKAMSKHFRCLKDAISDQLHFSNGSDRDDSLRLGKPGRVVTYGQRPFRAPAINDQPVWRPQRGLPERAVTVLRAWLFEHFLHPYPTDTDKLMLAKQTGLSRNQVSNWFINARVRLWKPMVEEIHMIETRENQKTSQRREQLQQPSNRVDDHLPSSCSLESENVQKHIQNRPSNKLPYDNLLHNDPQLGGCLSGNVSLTPGVHQNSVGPSESYPVNAAPRFGIDSHGEGYPLSSFATQNRQFGRDVILMHDFVG